MTQSDANQAFMTLHPDAILDAVERAGYTCDGRLQAMASYENRVYQVGVEDAAPVVVKFYRPGRWDDAQILEEHAFSRELMEADLPVLVPLARDGHGTLVHDGPYRLALYPRLGGRAPSFDDPEHRRLLGRFAARLHNVGALAPFSTRPALTLERHGQRSVATLLDGGWLPPELEPAYRAAADQALDEAARLFDQCRGLAPLRLHGDLHAGNILWTDDGPMVLDFDDCATGPALADLWMFLSGDRDYQAQCLANLIEGYELFRPFPYDQLPLVEALRTLRIMRHSAWLARRWSDPAFQRAFGYFDTQRYWQEHILALKEQIGAMQEPPLAAIL